MYVNLNGYWSYEFGKYVFVFIVLIVGCLVECDVSIFVIIYNNCWWDLGRGLEVLEVR